MKSLIHAHIYYPHMWDELQRCIDNITSITECDVYITMVEEHQNLIEKIKKWNAKTTVKIVDNRGYDVGPFIDVLNSVELEDYEYVIKLHTKRDINTTPWYINGFDMGGNKWRETLLGFCSSKENWCKSLERLKEPDCGMITDARLILKNCSKTFIKSTNWEEELGLTKIKEKKYVSGTMFVAKSEIFKPLIKRIRITDFPTTNRQEKVSPAHEMEQILGNLVYLDNKKIKSYDGKVVSIFHPVIFRLKKFLYYHKKSEKGEVIKIINIPIYSKKFSK